MITLIQAREQAELLARLFARGVPTPSIVVGALADPLAWSRLVSGFLDEGSGWERLTSAQRWTVLIVVVLLAVVGGFWRRRWLLHHPDVRNGRFLVIAAPWLLAVTGACVILAASLPGWPPPLITRLLLCVLIWLIFDILLQVWLVGRLADGLDQSDARSLTRWLRMLAALVLAGGLLSTAEAVIRMPDANYFLLRSVMACMLLIGVAWSAVILGRVPGLAGTRGLRVLMVLVVLLMVVAEAMGYRNLSMYLLQGISGTLLGLGFFGFIAKYFVFLFDGLDEGRYRWQCALRDWLKLPSHEPVPGLIWLRLVISLTVWSAFAVWALWVWGQSERWILQLVEYAVDGFDVGSLHIAPAQILGAITVLAIGISLTRWLKLRVVAEIVKRSRLDHGGREAVITVSGYAGITVSLLIALGVAGISYTNVAIVAGALSVGIGFGLTNVVNNFVSGLILLFERPVRTGDWVVVGDTQGYVRKISIRSTQIETFDRADVIVPNSELISNKVSNWMLRDPWGRITIPIGVAYGSDVNLVMRTLLDVAHAHEGVMKNHPGVALPKAQFRRFGDSALEFELRCFIRQIDKAIDITTDLNVAIDRAFREAGIIIPFPQQDVHVKELPH
jgi:small-conductance mechanosensitive channel